MPHAKCCVQEELTSPSVEHLTIDWNATYEKFWDKHLSTEGVGEPGASGKGGLWGPRADPGEGTAALGVLGRHPALPLPDSSDNISKPRTKGYKSGECEIVSPECVGM